MPTIAKWLGHADGGVLAMKVYSMSWMSIWLISRLN